MFVEFSSFLRNKHILNVTKKLRASKSPLKTLLEAPIFLIEFMFKQIKSDNNQSHYFTGDYIFWLISKSKTIFFIFLERVPHIMKIFWICSMTKLHFALKVELNDIWFTKTRKKRENKYWTENCNYKLRIKSWSWLLKHLGAFYFLLSITSLWSIS